MWWAARHDACPGHIDPGYGMQGIGAAHAQGQGIESTKALLLVVGPQLLCLVLDDVHQVELIACATLRHDGSGSCTLMQ